MSPPVLYVIVAIQLALIIGGTLLLWRLGLSPAGRAAPKLLGAWHASGTDFFLFLWFVMCGGFIAPFVTNFWLKAHPVSADAFVIIGTAAFHSGMLAGVLLYRLTAGRKAERASLSTTAAVNPLAAGVATYLVTLPVVTAVSLIWQLLLTALDIDAPLQDAIDILRHARPVPMILLLGSAIILAPFTEELIFRAGIFRYTRTRIPRWAALLLPSCLFSAMHVNLASFAPLVALGIMFSLAYERTGRISTTIVAHGLFNLTTTALILAGIDV